MSADDAPRRISPVIPFHEGDQFGFYKVKKLRPPSRPVLLTGSRGVVHGAERVIVRMYARIGNSNDDDIWHPFVVNQAANHGVEQFEIPLTVEQIKHWILFVLTLVVVSRLANVQIVAVPGVSGIQYAQFGSRNGDRRIQDRLS